MIENWFVHQSPFELEHHCAEHEQEEEAITVLSSMPELVIIPVLGFDN